MIKPTIGCVVWYKPFVHDAGGDQMHAATVAYVWADTTVNLSVADQNGNHYSRILVFLHQGDPESCPDGSCCWMPYQKAQAEKAEAAA